MARLEGGRELAMWISWEERIFRAEPTACVKALRWICGWNEVTWGERNRTAVRLRGDLMAL